MAKHVVGRTSEFPADAQRLVHVAGRDIAVFNVGGTLYALRNRCPHQGGPLSSGTVVGGLESAGPGDYRYRSDRKFVKCAWHSWEFDLATGHSRCDPKRQRVRAYPISVERGDSLIQSSPPEGGVPEALFAEVYPVTVEDDYVVVILDS